MDLNGLLYQHQVALMRAAGVRDTDTHRADARGLACRIRETQAHLGATARLAFSA